MHDDLLRLGWEHAPGNAPGGSDRGCGYQDHCQGLPRFPASLPCIERYLSFDQHLLAGICCVGHIRLHRGFPIPAVDSDHILVDLSTMNEVEGAQSVNDDGLAVCQRRDLSTGVWVTVNVLLAGGWRIVRRGR
jgi:hypothetical protein